MTRVAIVAGCRTPFAKAGTTLARYSFLDMGTHVVKHAVERAGIEASDVDEVVYSTVLLDPRTPNAARELVLRSGLSKETSAHFVSNNCISGLVAVNMIAEAIKSGRITCGIAGGSESMSQPTLTLSKKAERFWISLAKARGTGAKLSTLLSFRPSMIAPQPPSPKEPSTGLTMGQHCEMMAKEFKIAREAQDALAAQSHSRAAEASKFLEEEIVPLGDAREDNIVRSDTNVEKLSKLKPVFDRSPAGTLTAGNSSALTDGASAVVLMAEEVAKARGIQILGFLEGTSYAAIDPADGLLMAPVFAVPRLLQSLSLGLSDFDVFEIHEAFAAQVLCNASVWENGWEKFSDLQAVGRIDVEKMNKCGGSIAIGHPFAATGGRLIMSALGQLSRSQQNRALISVCAAGAMAAAVSVKRE